MSRRRVLGPTPWAASPWLTAALVLAVAVAAALVVWVLEQRRWDDRQEGLARTGAAALDEVFGRTESSLSGARVLAMGTDGTTGVSADTFEIFAADVLEGSQLTALVYEAQIPDAQRAAFEQEIGRPIVDLGRDGFVPAPVREQYAPARFVYPESEAALALLGFDILGDESRGPAVLRALESGRAAATAPIELAGGGLGVTIVRPVFVANRPAESEQERRTAIAGYVSTAFGADAISELLLDLLPPQTRLSVSDAGTELLSTSIRPGGEAGVTGVEMLGRSYTVRAEDGGGPGIAASAAIVAGGLIAAALAWGLASSGRRRSRVLADVNIELDRQRRETVALQRVTADLSRVSTATDAAQVLQRHIATLEHGVLGSAVMLRNLPDARDELDLVEGIRIEQAHAISTGDPEGVIGSSVLADRPRFGLHGSSANTEAESELFAGVADAAVLPLRGPGEAKAAVVILYDREQAFDEMQRARLSTLALLGGSALRRALRFDVEHAAASTLQRSLLPSAPVSARGVTVATRYRPASRSALVGGDWWDAFRIDEKCLAFVIGDAIGHGVSAAAAMGQLSSALRMAIKSGASPSIALDLADRYVEDVPGAESATALVAELGLEDGVLTWSRAGHMPPLLVRSDPFTIDYDEAGASTPIGLTDAPRPQRTVTMAPGDVVVLFTDGLIERRGLSLEQALDDLRDVVGSGSNDPNAICSRVMARFASGPSDDDQAMIAVRYDGLTRP